MGMAADAAHGHGANAGADAGANASHGQGAHAAMELMEPALAPIQLPLGFCWEVFLRTYMSYT